MRALICGGRDLDASDVFNWLERFGHQDAAEAVGWGSWPRITTIIHGAARGADEGAARWGKSEGIRTIPYPAETLQRRVADQPAS